MKTCIVFFSLFMVLSGLGLSGAATALAHEHSQANGAKATNDPSCHVPVHITEEAEMQTGGAMHHGAKAAQPGAHSHTMPEMDGAHMIHEPQHGGAFFMAPNKLHHLEGVYTDKCGFRLYFYNAFIKPIHADRFRAFVHIVPGSENEFDIIRFLSPSKDGTVLMASFGDVVSRPFEIEL